MGFIHIINAYEENDNIIIDAPFKSSLIEYNAGTISNLASPPEKLKEFMMSYGPSTGLAVRWALPLKCPTFEGEIREVESLGDTKTWVVANSTFYIHPEYLAPPVQYKKQRNMEFNMINPKFSGRKYQFTYAVGMPEGYLAGSIIKLDVIKKEFVKVWEDENCLATEPQFVPRPGSTEEEDGVLIFVCLGTNKQDIKTHFVVLDPNLQELGRFSVPFQTPLGFHGTWF